VALLKSALARPQRTWEYDKDADLAALAAEYGFGLAKSHPFADGNKRIAFVATNVFLLINGYEIDAPEPEVVNAMVRLADGRLTRSRFAQWIRKYLVKYKE
jgi:death-on-curing protein